MIQVKKKIYPQLCCIRIWNVKCSILSEYHLVFIQLIHHHHHHHTYRHHPRVYSKKRKVHLTNIYRYSVQRKCMYVEFNSNVIISLPEIIQACTVNLAAMTMMVVVYKSLTYMVAENTFQMLHIYNIKCHSIYPNCRM